MWRADLGHGVGGEILWTLELTGARGGYEAGDPKEGGAEGCDWELGDGVGTLLSTHRT